MTTYLILHRVRGKPAFDIAEKLDEEIWIIPTSGHRAYPFMHWDLEDLLDVSEITRYGVHDAPWTHDHEIPPDWPDHYQAAVLRTARPTKGATLEELEKML